MTDGTKLYPPPVQPPPVPGARNAKADTLDAEDVLERVNTSDILVERKPFRVPADSKMLRVEAQRPNQELIAVKPTDLLLETTDDDLDDGADRETITGVWSTDDIESELAVGEESHVIGGRYRITEGLAMGGMGAVFKVMHIRLQKPFALKIILSDRSSDANMQKFFFREARVLSQLTHPNIVQVTDFGRDESFGLYLVMEYLYGESLFDRLERHERLEVGVAMQIALQIAEALDYMHCRDVIHCDIKPENVFLCRDTVGHGVGEGVKLIDFGLSRTMVRGGKLDQSEVGGTPAYAAPEQLAGVAPTPGMDIYGVGVLLYALITGWPPFHGSVEKILREKRERDIVPPSQRLKQRLNPDVESLIMWAAARDPNKRPISMAQLIAELRTVILRLGYEVPDSAMQRARPVTGKHKITGEHDLLRFFSGCPWPVFLADRYGRFVAATPAFCAVVETPLDQLLGTGLANSRIGQIHHDVERDFSTSRQRRIALLRRIEFSTQDNAQNAVLLWIAPQITTEQEIERVWGILMPVG
ncbi:MAG: serine/threonine-protein kinase [bacterium]